MMNHLHPLTCFICGTNLDPNDHYTPFQGWLPANSNDPNELIEIERADDCRFCPTCHKELHTGRSASPPTQP